MVPAALSEPCDSQISLHHCTFHNCASFLTECVSWKKKSQFFVALQKKKSFSFDILSQPPVRYDKEVLRTSTIKSRKSQVLEEYREQ